MEPNLSDALNAAKSLLGWKLVHESSDGVTSGYIVETEAYTQNDLASHARNGQNLRNAAMFGPAGTIYVYFSYGIHYCMNIVTAEAGKGEAVLIRAIEPIEGIEIMKKRRGVDVVENLTNGPAKLVQAMGITKIHNNTNIDDGSVRIEQGIVPSEIVQSTRIGISRAVDHPWRFFIKDNPFVSHR